MNKRFHTLLFMICLPVLAFSQTQDRQALQTLVKSAKFDGTIKTKVEASAETGAMRFNVRNSRLGVRGDIGKYLSYRVQVELSNEGTFSPLDLYGRLNSSKKLSFLFGQTNIPFDNNYIISPAEMMFANRAFVGKYFTPGSRDIGAEAQYRFALGGFPMEGQAGVFNGGRINAPEWTNNPSYAFRLIAGGMNGFRSTAKTYKYNSENLDLLFWGADIRYSNPRLIIEAEVMNRHSNTTGLDLFGTYLQGAYTFDLHNAGIFHFLKPAARWDAMGYDVWNSGIDINRITLGLNFGLTFMPYDSVLRIDYEQYFLRKGLAFPDFDNRDLHIADNKITVELVVRF